MGAGVSGLHIAKGTASNNAETEKKRKRRVYGPNHRACDGAVKPSTSFSNFYHMHTVDIYQRVEFSSRRDRSKTTSYLPVFSRTPRANSTPPVGGHCCTSQCVLIALHTTTWYIILIQATPQRLSYLRKMCRRPPYIPHFEGFPNGPRVVDVQTDSFAMPGTSRHDHLFTTGNTKTGPTSLIAWQGIYLPKV